MGRQWDCLTNDCIIRDVWTTENLLVYTAVATSLARVGSRIDIQCADVYIILIHTHLLYFLEYFPWVPLFSDRINPRVQFEGGYYIYSLVLALV